MLTFTLLVLGSLGTACLSLLLFLNQEITTFSFNICLIKLNCTYSSSRFWSPRNISTGSWLILLLARNLVKNCKGKIKEFKSWRSECYHLVSANRGIVCSVRVFRTLTIQRLKLRYCQARCRGGSKKLKKVEEALGSYIDTIYFTENSLYGISQKIFAVPSGKPLTRPCI